MSAGRCPRRGRRWRAGRPLAALAVLPLLVVAGQTPGRRQVATVDLAVSAPPAVTYRIPALAVTAQGTLLAAFDRRHDSARDLPNHIDVMLRRSTDGGATWSAPRAIVREPAPAGCGDPSLLVDRTTQRVFLFCTFSAGRAGFGSAAAGDTSALHVQLRWSDDDGLRWSPPHDLNPAVRNRHWRAWFASSGHGIQTAAGRLIQPIVVRDSAGVTHAANLLSDDQGATWRAGALLPPGSDESKAVELSDGAIVQNVRPAAAGHRLTARSADGGRTFAAMASEAALPDPAVNGDIVRVNPAAGGSRRDWLLFVNAASTRARENLTLRLSCDGGRTWPASHVVQRGPAGYAAMAMLPDGRAGLLYERGRRSSFERLSFTAVPLAALAVQCAP